MDSNKNIAWVKERYERATKIYKAMIVVADRKLEKLENEEELHILNKTYDMHTKFKFLIDYRKLKIEVENIYYDLIIHERYNKDNYILSRDINKIIRVINDVFELIEYEISKITYKM